jgi:DNA-binding response OmpR family regulator
LVVDDYITIRKNHRLLLEKMGFKALEAADGEEALRRLRSAGAGKVSLMIVDLVMPVMNGAELISLCRKEFGEAAPRVLVCTSVSELPIVKKIVELGVDGYIVKPVDYRLLVKKIDELFKSS